MIAFIAQQDIMYLISEHIGGEECEVIANMTDINGVSARFKNATHYSHIIIDIDMFHQPPTEIVTALYLLRSTNNTKLIVIARGYEIGDELLSELVSHGIYNLVTSYDRDYALKQMSDCFAGIELDTVRHYINAESMSNKKTLFRHKRITKANISIGICGTQSRIGTTTQAIRLATAINAMGDRTVCYCEQNDSGHVELIKNVYPNAEYRGGYIEYCDLHLYYKSKPSPTAYNHIIYDYGTDVSQLDGCDLKIIVCGSKAWELTQLAAILESVNHSKHTEYIFSFTGSGEHSDLLDFMGERWSNTHFALYSPDMFAPITLAERELYSKVIDICPTGIQPKAPIEKVGLLKKLIPAKSGG